LKAADAHCHSLPDEKDGGKIHSDISVNGQLTSTDGTAATASDDQPDFGKIITNMDSWAFVTKINDLPKSAGIL
jgi:hypothetical protein